MTTPTRETPFSAEDFEGEADKCERLTRYDRLTNMLTQAAAQQRALVAIVRDIEAGEVGMNEIHELAQAALGGTHGD